MYPRYKLTGLCICAVGAALLIAATGGMSIGLSGFAMLAVGAFGGATILAGALYQSIHPRRVARRRHLDVQHWDT